MRVGLLVYGDLGSRSGGFIYDRRLVAHLRDRGNDVEVVSLPQRSYPARLARNVAPSIARRLRRASFDVLVQDELAHPSLAWRNRRLRRRVDYPLVALVHLLRSRVPAPFPKRRFHRAIERRYLASVDGYVLNSEATREGVAALVGSDPSPRVLAYPAGDRFDRERLPERRDVERRAREGPLRVLFVGNVVPRKGLHALVEGLARLDGGWRLTAVGDLESDPAYTDRVRERIAALDVGDRVDLVGALPDDDLARTLTDHHLLAVPSTYEAFGIVYVEAMGFGLPALASTAGAGPELLDGAHGLLVPPGDPGAIADAIGPLRSDRDRLARMGIAARERFEAHPTWEETCATVRSFLRRVAG